MIIYRIFRRLLMHYPHLSRRVLGHEAAHTTCLRRCSRCLPEMSLPKFRVTGANSATARACLPNVRKREPVALCGWRQRRWTARVGNLPTLAKRLPWYLF